jgi:hypothetical protein
MSDALTEAEIAEIANAEVEAAELAAAAETLAEQDQQRWAARIAGLPTAPDSA